MNRLFPIVAVLAVIFLGYILGAAAMHYRFGKADYLEEMFKILEASGVIEAQRKLPAPLFIGGLPPKGVDNNRPGAPDWRLGVHTFKEDKVQPGLTIYTPVNPWTPITLIDLQGNPVHQWEIPRELEVIENRDDGHVFPRPINPPVTDLHVYPNGNLLVALGNDLGFPPFGYAVVLLDKDSNVLWTYSKDAHHRINVADNGDIAVLLNAWIEDPWPGLESIPVPFREDEIAILRPDGTEKKRISVMRAFQNSEWQGALKQISHDPRFKDKFHTNAVQFLTAEQAKAIPYAKEGNVLLSMRNVNLLAVMDLEAEVITWAARGPWYMQHDPHVLPNGNILLFDNHGELKHARRSRILEINPRNLAIEWEWPGENDFNMYTSIAGAVEPLDNGNVLIAETNRGRLLEVNREGEVVWDFRVPERKQTRDRGGKVYTVTKAWNPKRLDPATLDFLTDDGDGS